jgi:hypothetical protein
MTLGSLTHRKRLIDPAREPYRTASPFAYHFAHGKARLLSGPSPS